MNKKTYALLLETMRNKKIKYHCPLLEKNLLVEWLLVYSEKKYLTILY